MAENSSIEWTDHTFNPWIGRQRVSPGCEHCYAEAMNKRTGGANWGAGAARRRTSESYWRQPLKWNSEARRWTRLRWETRRSARRCRSSDAHACWWGWRDE